MNRTKQTSSDQEVLDNYKAYGSRKRTRRETGCGTYRLQRIIESNAGVEASNPNPKPVAGHSLKEFGDKFDYSSKLRKELAGLNGSYTTDQEMKSVCGADNSSWRNFSLRPEFAENRLRWQGSLYWGNPATIKEMKKMTGQI